VVCAAWILVLSMWWNNNMKNKKKNIIKHFY
jgi:hypothetical protein